MSDYRWPLDHPARHFAEWVDRRMRWILATLVVVDLLFIDSMWFVWGVLIGFVVASFGMAGAWSRWAREERR